MNFVQYLESNGIPVEESGVEGLLDLGKMGYALLLNYTPMLQVASVLREDGVLLNIFCTEEWISKTTFLFRSTEIPPVVPKEYQETVTRILETEYKGEYSMPGLNEYLEKIATAGLLASLEQGDTEGASRFTELLSQM